MSKSTIRRIFILCLVSLIFVMWEMPLLEPAQSYAAAPQYRIFQEDHIVRDAETLAGAKKVAAKFKNSHIERIKSKEWVWDNLPRYKVYVDGYSTPAREFVTLRTAKQFAAKQPFAQIRDLRGRGWLANSTYPRYRLYQGDKTQDAWQFATLDEAKQVAKYYENAHVIELSTLAWKWDNLTPAAKEAARSGAMRYEVRSGDDAVQITLPAETQYAFLLDAIRAANQVRGSIVVNLETGNIVHDVRPVYDLYAGGELVSRYFGIGNAVIAAKAYENAQVKRGELEVWTNEPYYVVMSGDEQIGAYYDLYNATDASNKLNNTRVETRSGDVIWTNEHNLKVLAWNGVAETDIINEQLWQTRTLDVDSPSWFELAAADGSLRDRSDPALASILQSEDVALMPLVNNQFDANLTTKFLADSQARVRFIDTLMERLLALGADGINLDFESMRASDREAYTDFVQQFTDAAHVRGLLVSLDMPRGDTAWDEFTAFDHQALAGIVDQFMIMTYDEHWAGGDEIGSVASLPWTEQGVQNFLAYGIPAGQLYLGIPFYVRDWRVDEQDNILSSRALMMKSIPDVIAEYDAVGEWDAAAGQTKYTYYKDGNKHIFWAETPETVQKRIDIAQKYKLAGIAIWRLGYEQAEVWEPISEN